MSKSMNTYLEYARQISKILTNKMKAVGNKHKLTKMEAHALLFFSVDSHEPIASEFCKCGSYPKSNVSKALLNLSKRNFITMESREGDRRYQEVKLTEEGLEVAKEIRAEIDPILAKLSKGLDPKDKQVLYSAMNTLKQNIDDMMIELFDEKNKEKL